MVFLLFLILHLGVFAADNCLRDMSCRGLQRILGLDVGDGGQAKRDDPELLQKSLAEVEKNGWRMSVTDVADLLRTMTKELFDQYAKRVHPLSDFMDMDGFLKGFIPVGNKKAQDFLLIILNAELRDIAHRVKEGKQEKDENISERLNVLVDLYSYIESRLVFTFSLEARPCHVQNLLSIKKGELLLAIPGILQEKLQGSNFFGGEAGGFCMALGLSLCYKATVCRNMAIAETVSPGFKEEFIDVVLKDAGDCWGTDGVMRLLLCSNWLQLDNSETLLRWRRGDISVLLKAINTRMLCEDDDVVDIAQDVYKKCHGTKASLRRESCDGMVALSKKYIESWFKKMPNPKYEQTQKGLREGLAKAWGVPEVSDNYESYQDLQVKVVARICAIEKEEGLEQAAIITEAEQYVKRYLDKRNLQVHEVDVTYISEGPSPPFLPEGMMGSLIVCIPLPQEVEKMSVSTRRAFLLKFVSIRDFASDNPRQLSVNSYQNDFFQGIKKHCLEEGQL